MTHSGSYQEQDPSQQPTNHGQLHSVDYWKQKDQTAYEQWVEATGASIIEGYSPNENEPMPVVQLTAESFERVLPHIQHERQRRLVSGDTN